MTDFDFYNAYKTRLHYIFTTTDSVKELREAYKLLQMLNTADMIEMENEKDLAHIEELKNKIKGAKEGDE
ncbi:hypothetical protein J3T26_09865 [Salmonella enterica]|uniref:hypothetical protein n=1 Tax=Salmonella enterica TaxID=28901 RepID=UPI0021D4E096|nr:hypothetical protein [Salmonella enterica]EIR2646819.1 hypothetical protein [Salmonella enterica subsp. enterica serovar Enteritidis]MCU7121050.1 hypothetical protein [Salmonella enterica]